MFAPPLHPSLVHLPIGFALVLPLILGALFWSIATLRARPRNWAWGVLFAFLLVSAAVVAASTGESDAELLAGRMAQGPIRAHEEAATAVVTSSVAAFILALGGLARTRRTRHLSMALALLASVGVASLVLRACAAGTRLVYEHGAGDALRSQPPL